MQSSAHDDGRKHRPKHVEPTWNNILIYIVHLVGYFHSCITMHGFMNIKRTECWDQCCWWSERKGLIFFNGQTKYGNREGDGRSTENETSLPYRYDVMFYFLGLFCPEEGGSIFCRNTCTTLYGITSQKTVILTPCYGYVIFLAPHRTSRLTYIPCFPGSTPGFDMYMS